jgi:hypothetical protein
LYDSPAARRAVLMVGVAQLVEHLVVVQVAAGSSPVTHPTRPRPDLHKRRLEAGFLIVCGPHVAPVSGTTAVKMLVAAREPGGQPGARLGCPWVVVARLQCQDRDS